MCRFPKKKTNNGRTEIVSYYNTHTHKRERSQRSERLEKDVSAEKIGKKVGTSEMRTWRKTKGNWVKKKKELRKSILKRKYLQ